MNSFIVLFKKELLEAWRDKKLIWLPIVLTLLAITQPISSYYMPEILEMAGNLPEGAVIKIPTPTGAEVLAGTLSQFGVLGTAIYVLSAMGIVSNERNSGSLSLIMARPVSPFTYMASKWTAHAVIFLFSFILSYSLAYYYTNLLFSHVKITSFLSSLGMYSLWILFVLTVTLLAGTLLKKTGGIAGVSLIILAVLSMLTSLLPNYMRWSPASTQGQAGSILMKGAWEGSWLWGISATIVLILIVYGLAVMTFKRFENY